MRRTGMKLVGVVVGIGIALWSAAADAGSFTVQVGPNNTTSFVPATPTVAAGTTVHWTWSSTSPLHSVTSGTCSGSTCSPDGRWDSGVHGGPFTFDLIFAGPLLGSVGTYPYFCSVHGAAMQGAITVKATPHDFDANGKSDILWRNTSSGGVAMWLMDGATIASGSFITTVPTVWTVVGVADFDGDAKADILWRDTSGNLALWIMDGTAPKASSILGNVSTQWTIVGVADFNGDGNADSSGGTAPPGMCRCG